MYSLQKNKLLEFLRGHKASDDAHTHTSMDEPFGSFLIRDDEYEEFFKIYHEAVFVNGQKAYLTERIRDREYTPFRVDLDFRYYAETLERKYTQEDIIQICQMYMEIMEEYFLELGDAERLFFIMEKDSPVFDYDKTTKTPKTNEAGLFRIKDGIHIMAPNISINVYLGLKFRDYAYKNVNKILDKYTFDNNYADIFDRAVIDKNNWQMYGSRKPGLEAYRVTHVYKINRDSFEEVPLTDFTDEELVYLLSVRRHSSQTSIRFDKYDEVFENNGTPNDLKKPTARRSRKKTINKVSVQELNLVKKYVDCLSEERATHYQTWIEVGWALHNIHNKDDELLNAWIEFSKKAPAYALSCEDECRDKWGSFQNEGYGIGSIKLWARQDNPDLYSKIVQHDIASHILIACKSPKGSEFDVAKVVYHMYRDLYKCVSTKGMGDWYYFNQALHRWVHDSGGMLLRQKFSVEVFQEFSKLQVTFQNKALESEDENAQKSQKIMAVMAQLKKTAFKGNILKECQELFYDAPGVEDSFVQKLDSKNELIGFKDGVYDLVKEEFRPGRPEDYITMSTKINYMEYDENNEDIIAIHKFLKKILVIKNVREYVLLSLASMLSGTTKDEIFDIWSGKGGNGKSKLIELFESVIGDYGCKLPITLLTQSRAASNAATPEMARTKGKRFASLQEPDTKTTLNVGLMKELTGGDKITARALFSEPIEFKPQFKMVLTCNDKPELPSKDDGTWRRTRLTEFRSKFRDKPIPNNPFEFKKDDSVNTNFEDWKEPFMAILIHYYKKYKKDGIKYPDEITEYTNIYKEANDQFQEFINACISIDMTSEEKVNIDKIYEVYKLWHKSSNPDSKAKKKVDLKNYLDEKFGIPVRPGETKHPGYRNVKLTYESAYGSDPIVNTDELG